MQFVTLSPDDVVLIHDEVLNEGELPGLARDKSLEGALSRVDFRLAYGLINDVFDLAATYAVVIATGHVFNDANKRTAFKAMRLCLHLNHVQLSFETEEIGRKIIEVAQGNINEIEFAEWLRNLP